jgi:hypothetical protein
MQGLDAAELVTQGSSPESAFDADKLGAAAVSGAVEFPVDVALGGLIFGPLGRLLKGRNLTKEQANDLLARAVVGDAATAYSKLKRGEAVSSDFENVLSLAEQGWEPILAADKPAELFQAAVKATKVTPPDFVKPPNASRMSESELVDFYNDQWKNTVANHTDDMAAVMARAEKGERGKYDGSLVSEIAQLIDHADTRYADLGVEFNVGKDVLPRLGNVVFKNGKVNVDELLKSGNNTIVGQAVDFSQPDRLASAKYAAELIEGLVGKSKQSGLGPRVLQDLKVTLDSAVSQAHGSSKNIPAKKEMQRKFSNLYRGLLGESIEKVDAAAGTQFGKQLAEKRQQFTTIKESLPAFNRYQSQAQTGALDRRLRVDRNIPGSTLGGAAIGGGVGRALQGATGVPGLDVAGAVVGAAVSTKRLPSRLQKVMKAKRNLGAAPTMRDNVVDISNVLLTGQISREVTNLTEAEGQGLESIKDAMAVALMKDQGLVDTDGSLIASVPPEFDAELESQIEAAIGPISEALRSGDLVDVAAGVATVAKQFPSAFPNAEFKGEVTVRGKRMFPLLQDRMHYSGLIRDDESLDKAQKAKMRSAVHKDGSIISPPSRPVTAPIKD